MMGLIKLTIEYDGTQFSGWQIQTNRRTVQGEIEKALQLLTGEKIRITGSGRTDAGVHALGQVASFRSHHSLPLSAFRDGLNGYLPEDVKIIQAEEAGDHFHARRDAVSRTYRYIICRKLKVLGRQYGWFRWGNIHLASMMEAAECLVGDHDFSSFCKVNGQTKSFVSRILDITWDTNEEEIRFEVTATHFFHNMIRIIMGTLLEVGQGRVSIDAFREILEARDRSKAGPTVPAKGLVLVKVSY
jgi:tRNA pseudouridine38-40 synthase